VERVIHDIERRGKDFYAQELRLICRYPGGDYDTFFRTWKQLYSACYDLHQCYARWKDGDVLRYAGVEFARIESFHVLSTLKLDQPLPEPRASLSKGTVRVQLRHGEQGRTSPEFGPFPYVEFTASGLYANDGEHLIASFHQGLWWHDGNTYTDITIYGG
jgi:hypothetical protein